ncbi:MAG: SUMF1/EgtB/PvdO family nonheme iron enzyme [Candidatus Marinimicrobia bacterium]|nr:SUMF1/EgtB/PvdO family nonheme iron enzyme [Candidatus Neomarinimicrobiota bacterium]
MRKIAISLTILFTIINYSCSLFLPDDDETPPVIVMNTPAHLDVVYETALVTCTATDEEGVAGTELFVDDVGTGLIDTTAPYSFDWNTLELENGSSHVIYVQGWDINDNYANSDTIVVYVDNSIIHPAPIENIDISYQPIGYLISWPMVEHERFSSYSLRRSEKLNMEGALTLFTSAVAADTVYFDSLANPLVSYFYQLLITDDLNYISVGAVVESPSPESFAPSGLTATSSDTTIRLRWNDNSQFEEGFIIERDDGSGYVTLDSVAANATEYLDVAMTYGKQYRYRIAIFYETVNSEFSNIYVAYSPLGFSPSGLAADATPLTIILRWDDNCIFESGFRLERDAGLGYLPLVELGPNVTGYEDADLEYDRFYRYRVAAFTETMQSDYSTYYSIYSPLVFAPINLSLTPSDTSIVLNWEDNCVFETGFIIQRSESSVTGSGYLTLDSVDANVTTWTDFNIEEDAWYYYRVAAYVPDQRSGYTTTSGIGSPLNFAPTSLTATAVDTSIQLRWTDNCIFEDGFVIERDAGSGFVTLAEVGENITGYLDQDMAYGIVYHYRVAALDDGRLSNYSWEVSRLSPLQFAPSYLTASHAGNSIQLVWNDNCNFEEGYVLERNAGAGYAHVVTLGANTTNYLDTDMAYDVLYRYRLVAYAGPDVSDYAISSSIRSPMGFAPTNLVTVSNDTSITLNWNDECIFEEGFVIERNEGAGYVVQSTVGIDVTSYTDTDLTEGKYYQYRVAAFASGEQSDYAWSVGITSPIIFAPFSLYATAIGNTIAVRWTDLCTFEEGFTVERDAGTGFEVIGQVAANTTNITDSDLEYGIEYRYRAAAFTSEEVSNYSNITTIISPLTFTPSSLFAFPNTNSIDLSWQDNCIFETGFHIERDVGSGFVLIDDVGANVTTYSDGDLVEGVTYRYRVSAFTATMQSNYSATIVVDSPIAFTPINFQAVTQNNSIDLSWTDNCSFEDGFTIERDDGSGTFVEIGNLGANYTFFSDDELEYYTIYRYRVAAYTATEQSNYTPIINVQSPVDITPSDLVATSFDTEILLEWQDNSSAEEGFRIYRNDGGGYDYDNPLVSLSADVTDYTDYSVNYGIEYSYRVSAFANGQESAYTNEATGSIAWLYSEWVTIAAGDYTLGEAGYETGPFVHTVPGDFEMMQFEVTNNQYAAFMEGALVAGEIVYDELVLNFRGGAVDSVVYNLGMTGGHIQWDGSAFSIDPGYELHPVVGVTWHGADAFATFYGWSLPTKEEWEVAARGTTGSDYPWGDEDPTCDLANFSGCSAELIQVGQTPDGVSPFDVYDMVGNAWEWTGSYFDGANNSYVLKGGSWSNYTDNLKVWYNTEGVPGAAYNTIGFRCVR